MDFTHAFQSHSSSHPLSSALSALAPSPQIKTKFNRKTKNQAKQNQPKKKKTKQNKKKNRRILLWKLQCGLSVLCCDSLFWLKSPSNGACSNCSKMRWMLGEANSPSWFRAGESWFGQHPSFPSSGLSQQALQKCLC